MKLENNAHNLDMCRGGKDVNLTHRSRIAWTRDTVKWPVDQRDSGM